MSGTGAPEDAPLRAEGRSVAIVAGRWHGEVVDALLSGAVAACEEAGAAYVVVRAPGAFEIPVVAQALARTHDAVVALGVVMRGGTPHFDYVCRAVTDGCVRVALDSGKPVGFGVLTVDDEDQARARLDKGREAVRAVLETLATLDGIA
ncbi:MAG TPA: 6,7-dimethyl-8-ribityllumazine synthase [Frankiaceae bacterium]|nr:6,7-dimethyl-8-ribityllumazine synthase [Frankiaceae bacterium]